MIGKATLDSHRAVQLHQVRGEQLAPGKRTLTEGLPVQRKDAGAAPAASASTSTDAVHAAAQHG
jgi:hypothetical protein